MIGSEEKANKSSGFSAFSSRTGAGAEECATPEKIDVPDWMTGPAGCEIDPGLDLRGGGGGGGVVRLEQGFLRGGGDGGAVERAVPVTF